MKMFVFIIFLNVRQVCDVVVDKASRYFAKEH